MDAEIPPLIRYLFRAECPACHKTWLASRWDAFFYPLHYAAEHMNISPWRTLP